MPGPSKLATAYLLIRAQTGQLTHDLNRVRRSFIGQMSAMAATAARLTGRKFVNVLTSTLKWGMLAATGIMAGTIWGSLRLASAAEEIENKYRVVFKGINEEADAFVKGFRERFGLATTDLRQWMAAFQDTFVPLGFARKKAMELSASLVELSVDLSSFHDTDPALAMRRMTSALVGNHEAVRAYGIILTESVLNAKLLEQGINKTSVTASAQEKVLARLAVIMDGTADAQGDMERSANSYANTMRRMWANIKQLFEGIGNIIMPVFTGISNVTGAFAELAAKVVDGQLPRMKKWLDEIKEVLDDIADVVRTITMGEWMQQLGQLWSLLKPAMAEVLSGIGRMFKVLALRVGEDIGSAIHRKIYDSLRPAARWSLGIEEPLQSLRQRGNLGQDMQDAFMGKQPIAPAQLEKRMAALQRLAAGDIDALEDAVPKRAPSTMPTAFATLRAGLSGLMKDFETPQTKAQRFSREFEQQRTSIAKWEFKERGLGVKLGELFETAKSKFLETPQAKYGAKAIKAAGAAGKDLLGMGVTDLTDAADTHLNRLLGRITKALPKEKEPEPHRAAFVGFDAYSDQLQLALSNQQEPQQRMAKALDQLAAGTGGFFNTMGKFFSEQTVKLEKALKAPARAAPG